MARHRGRCRICKHPEREEIEREFLDWMSPREIAETWKIASYRAIYRHAHAVGLFELRRKNWQGALDRIIERVGEVQVTAAAVVAAIRLSAKLDSCSGKATADRRGRASGSEDGTLGEGQKFVLSLDGLPRTDAVTGHVRRDAKGTLQRAPTAGDKGGVRILPEELAGDDEPQGRVHRQQSIPPGNGRPSGSPLPAATARPGPDFAKATAGRQACSKETEDDASAGSGNNEEIAGGEKGARTGRQKTASRGVAAPLEPQPVPVERDPRVVFGEDGRVAGIPWPKGKVAFARGRRWRGGRGG